MSIPSLKVYANGQGTVTGDNLNTFQQICTNIAMLRTFTAKPGMQVFLQGTASVGDGGQGPFWFNASAVASDNGTTVIVPTGSSLGAWVRLGYMNTTGIVAFSGVFQLSNFGAKWDGVTNDTVAVNAALTAASAAGSGVVMAPSGIGLVSNIVVPANVIFDLSGSTISPFAGAQWVVKLNGRSATLRNGTVNDPLSVTLYTTTTTAIIGAGVIGTPVTFPVTSVANLAVGKLIAITQTNGSHAVSKVTNIVGLNVTIPDGLSVGASNGAIIQTAHGLIMTDQALNGLIDNILIPSAPVAIEMISSITPANSSQQTVNNVMIYAAIICAIFRDVNVATTAFYDVVAFGHSGVSPGYVGYYGEARNPGLYPSGGNSHTDIVFLTFETGWQLRGCQLDEFHNCQGDTYGSAANGGIGWDIGAVCQKLRFTSMWGAYTAGQVAPGIGVKISGGCLGIMINGLYTRLNVTADLSIDAASQVYLIDETWGESRVFTGGGTYNQVFPTIIGGAAGNESVRVKNAGAMQINRWELTGNVTGFGVLLSAAGGDANISAYVISKGTGAVTLQNNSAGVPSTVFYASGPINAVNYLLANAVASGAPGLSTNAGNLSLSSFTGLVQFAGAASSSANGSVATVLGSVGPVGSHTAVQEWLTIVTASGATRYIPCF